VDHESRSGVSSEKKRRDALITLAQTQPTWALGCADEVWWSRVSAVVADTWSDPDQPARVADQDLPKDDPDPAALACYGLLLRHLPHPAAPDAEQMWLRFVDGRPVSGITTQFLDWCCTQLVPQGLTTLVLVWDNASWHTSNLVRTWVRAHNRQVQQEHRGVRIVPCWLPSRSPWLNPIEPKWLHGRRAVTEPARLLTGQDLADRVCAYYGCIHEEHLSISEQAA
jgi:hypothetical protein